MNGSRSRRLSSNVEQFGPMVLFHNVIEVLDLTEPRASPQFTIFLHIRHGARVGRVLVHRDGARVHRVWLRQRLAEEPLRRLGIALGRKQQVNGLAAAVNGSIQVGPAPMTFTSVSSTRQEPLLRRRCGRIRFSNSAAYGWIQRKMVL